MKHIWILTLPLIFFSCEKAKTGEDDQIQVEAYTIDQFYANEEVYAGGFSPDETKLLMGSNKTGIYNAYALPVDGSGPEQLTNSDEESIFIISYFPEDERILYHADVGGNENDHLYLRNTDGNIQDLTPWDSVKSNFYGWARDEKSFFFTSNKRDPRFFDLYEMDIDNFEPALVYQNNEGYSIGSISKNKRYLVLVRPITTNNSEMYLYDLQNKELTHLTPHEGDISYSPQFFDLANENLYYLTDEGSEFTYLMKYSMDSGDKEKVWSTEWDVWYAYDSYNEKYRVFGVNENAKTTLYLFDLASGEPVDLPDFGDRSITSINISKSENLMRLHVSSSAMPNNIFVYNFETKDLKQLTNTLNPEINPNHLVEGEAIKFTSYDSLEVPAIWYEPHQASADSPVPALVWVHGGPGGQTRLSYFSLIQFLVNHGYAILAVNNRGSSGYGKTFFKMDDQKHGDVDLKDCIASKEWLNESGVVDTSKIGIIGGSYGGYMTMAALTFAPEEFDVGVNIFGVTNWIRTLRSVPPYWESFKKALYAELGDPYSADSVRLYNISPLFHAENVTKPLMVLQGANDARVLQVESDEIVNAVKANGVPVEYMLFDDEGHGFVKKENEINGYGKILEFLDEYLKKEPKEQTEEPA